MIYLDSNATTRPDPQVVESMLPWLSESYANPSASYRAARFVGPALEKARGQVAALLQASPAEIVFTSGGTESNNAVIESAKSRWPGRRGLVIGATEHPAVWEPSRRWQAQGGRLTVVSVGQDGMVDLAQLREAVDEETALVSVMWANNETGVLAPIAEIAAIAHAMGALMHTDAVQAAGKERIDVAKVPVDYLTLSAHKFHGPKGVGALYASRRVRFEPWLLGGGQEAGRRSGTENVAGIVGLGKAAELMSFQQHAEVKALRDAFESKVLAATGATVNGHPSQRLATTSSLCFHDVDASALLILLDERGICCSASSACHTASLQPSHVLAAMGLDYQQAASSVRFSFSRFNVLEEVLEAADFVIEAVRKMRALGVGGPVAVIES